MQISNDGSGEDNSGTEDETRMLTIFLLDAIVVILSCACIQGVLYMVNTTQSKRLKARYTYLRKNYNTYQNVAKAHQTKNPLEV
jgi:hypothetical protein